MIRTNILFIVLLTLICCLIAGLTFAETSKEIVVDLGSDIQKKPVSRPISKATSRASTTSESVRKNLATEKVGDYVVTQVDSNVYKSYSVNSGICYVVSAGTMLIAQKEKNGFYGILLENGTTGWLNKSNANKLGYELYANRIAVPKGIMGYDPLSVPFSEYVTHSYSFANTPYVFGGTSPTRGMDCSAFVREIFSRMGVKLPRTAREQALVGTTVNKDPNDFIVGDRLYFRYRNAQIDHTGIYVGNGYYIHCSSSRNGVACDYLLKPNTYSKLVAIKRF